LTLHNVASDAKAFPAVGGELRLELVSCSLVPASRNPARRRHDSRQIIVSVRSLPWSTWWADCRERLSRRS